MLRTPYNNIKLSKVKTRGPEDGGNIGEWCRKITATVWTIAIGEPTPFGEIVASVATVLLRQDSFMRLFCVKKMRETAIWILHGKVRGLYGY